MTRALNDPSIEPRLGYRRNHIHYTLVCCVNCLMGCRISGNVCGEAAFVRRIAAFMADHPPTEEVVGYYDLVEKYVAHASAKPKGTDFSQSCAAEGGMSSTFGRDGAVREYQFARSVIRSLKMVLSRRDPE